MTVCAVKSLSEVVSSAAECAAASTGALSLDFEHANSSGKLNYHADVAELSVPSSLPTQALTTSALSIAADSTTDWVVGQNLLD